MNIVKLAPEEQILVVNTAINILRERILGKVGKIDSIDQEFVGFKREDVAGGLPDFPANLTHREREKIIEN